MKHNLMIGKTQFKTNIIERYKNGESSYKISKNEGCSYNAVLRELKRRGVNTGLRFWTGKEIEKLKEFYPVASNEELLKEFPNRKQGSVKGMAEKLGLKKKECKRTCGGCGEEFTIKSNHSREFCLKCVKKQWECNNPKNAIERQKQWLQKTGYTRTPRYRERANQYCRQLRKENPKFRLDQNMCSLIYQSLKGKKAGRKWQELIGYNLKDLVKHLEEQFDDKMNWENYGSYWVVDHIKPRSLFKYTFPEDPEFKKCWALENLQPLEKITNLRKNDTFTLCNTFTLESS